MSTPSDTRTELGRVQLRGGRVLAFEHVELIEHESHSFEVVSINTNGKRYTVRVPANAVGVLRMALDAFEQHVFGTEERKCP